MGIADNIKKFAGILPQEVRLVAVSKFHTKDEVQEAYDAGQRVFGESWMQELDDKQGKLPQDIEWHFIGHLQRNKVKGLLPYIHTIHSVDSIRLLAEIEKQAIALNKPVCCLLQIHIADETTKYGFTFDECRQFLAENTWRELHFAYLGGLMGMATNTDDKEKIRSEFKELKQFYTELKQSYFRKDDRFNEISMGMSEDYQIAIEEGSTLIRVGSSIFGERKY